MNNNSLSLVHIIAAIVLIAVLSIITFFVGVELAKKFILVTAQHNGINVPLLSDWEKYYIYLVRNMGVITALILSLWVALSHWFLRTDSSIGHGKRWLWSLLFVILIAAQFGLPYLYVQYYPVLIIDVSIPILFFVSNCLLGYWGGSIFLTADRYAYTPPLAYFFRAKV